MAAKPTGSVQILSQFWEDLDGNVWQNHGGVNGFEKVYMASQVDEIAALKASIEYVNEQITDTIEYVNQGDETNAGSIVAETNRATGAEEVLDEKIDTEVVNLVNYINSGDAQVAASVVDETNARISQGDTLQENIDAIAGGVLNIITSSEPTENINTYNASEAGTYTNFGGIVVSSGDLVGNVVQIKLINGVWTKFVTAIADLANYIEKASIGRNPTTYPKNIFNINDVLINTNINTSGAIISSTGFKTSKPIIFDKTQPLTINVKPVTLIKRYRFLDVNQNYITGSVGSISGNVAKTLNVVDYPDSAIYIQVNFKRVEDTDEQVAKTQIEKGSTETSFSPWHEPILGDITSINYEKISNADKVLYDKEEVDVLLEELKTELESEFVLPVFSTTEIEFKNKFNKATATVGFIDGNSGAINNTTDTYRKSDFIPVEELTDYHGEGLTRGMRHIAMYNYEKVFVSGGFNTEKKQITTPIGVYFVRCSIWKEDLDTFQFEKGVSKTSYENWEPPKELVNEINDDEILSSYIYNSNGDAVSTSKVLFINEEPKGITLSIPEDGTQYSTMNFKFNGKNVEHRIRPYRPLSLSSSTTFEFFQTLVDNVIVHETDDDGTPYRFNQQTLGANHGFTKTIITLINHGKQNVDVGSIWSDGVKQYIITNIVDANTLEVSARIDNSTMDANSLVHVSGATNTATIDATNKVQLGKFFPIIKNMVRRLYIDGKEVVIEPQVSQAIDTVTFSEHYEIMSKPSIMEWLILQVGNPDKIMQFDGESDVIVSNSYVFDTKIGCTQYQDFTALKSGLPFSDIMFIQLFLKSTVDAPILYYIPKTLPITYNSVAYDFSKKVNITNLIFNSTTDNLNFTSDYTESTGILADRAIRLQNSIGLAIGFIPVRSAGIVERRINATRKALQIRGSKKIYMSAIDSLTKNTLNAGDNYSIIGYRKFFELSDLRTAYYQINTTEGVFVYLDWHEAKTDYILLDSDLLGRKMEVVEKSSTVDLLTKIPTDFIMIKTTGDGYLILKFD